MPLQIYDSGPLSGPVSIALRSVFNLEPNDATAGLLLMALVGWDQAVLALASSAHPRADAALVTVVELLTAE